MKRELKRTKPAIYPTVKFYDVYFITVPIYLWNALSETTYLIFYVYETDAANLLKSQIRESERHSLFTRRTHNIPSLPNTDNLVKLFQGSYI